MVVMDKGCLAMVLYNLTASKAAVEQQEPTTKRPRPKLAEETGAVILYNAVAVKARRRSKPTVPPIAGHHPR
jgi:hypothetical protein